VATSTKSKAGSSPRCAPADRRGRPVALLGAGFAGGSVAGIFGGLTHAGLHMSSPLLWILVGSAAVLALALSLIAIAVGLLLISAVFRVRDDCFDRTAYLIRLLPRAAAFASAVRAGNSPDAVLPLGEPPPLDKGSDHASPACRGASRRTHHRLQKSLPQEASTSRRGRRPG